LFSTPAAPQTPDFSATAKYVVSGLNTVSELYEKQTLTNGDVLTISGVACSDIGLVASNGSAAFISNILSKYDNKVKEGLSELTAEDFSRYEGEFLAKNGASETAQRVVVSQILAQGNAKTAGSPTNAEENLRRIGGVACELKDKNLGNPNELANADLTKLGHAMATAVIGIAVAVVDIAITADTAGVPTAIVGFVSTSWGWDQITTAWEEAKAAWASSMGRKDMEPEKKG
jgi:hypothetical protein